MKADSKYSWGDFSDILAAVNRGIDSVMKDVSPQWYENQPADEPVKFELTEDGLRELLFGKPDCDWWWESGVLKPDGLPTKIIKAKQLHLFYKEKDSIADEVTRRYKLTNRDGGEIEKGNIKQAAFYTLNNCFDEINERVFCELKKLFQERLNVEVLQSVKYEKEIIAFLLALELEQRPIVHSTADFYNENHFIGRDEEMARAKTFVTDSKKKTLVLSGPGMVGKSYLMEETVREIETDNSDWVMRWNNPLKTNKSIWERLAYLFGETAMRKILSKYYSVCVCVEGEADSPDALMSEIDRIHKECDCKLIITTRLDIKETDHIEVIKLQPLSEEALKKLFLSYASENACPGIADQIVSSVSGNALLMWLIADACSRYEKKEAIDQIRYLLNMLLAQQQFYQKKSLDVYSELKKIEYATILSAKGHVLEHLRRAFTQYFPDEAQILLHMLSCLSGMTIPRSYLERWFNLPKPDEGDEQKTGIVEPLIRLGWIRKIDEKNVVILIPKIVAVNMITKEKEKKSHEKMKYYVDAFCGYLIDEALCPEDGALLEEVIFRLHDYFLTSLNIFKADSAETKNMEDLKQEEADIKDICKKLSYQFQLASILFFLWQWKPQQTQRLLEVNETLSATECSGVTRTICESWISMVSINSLFSQRLCRVELLKIRATVLRQMMGNIGAYTLEELELISEYLVFIIESWVNYWKSELHRNREAAYSFSRQYYSDVRFYISLHSWILKCRREQATDKKHRVSDMRGLENIVCFANTLGSFYCDFKERTAPLDNNTALLACAIYHDLKRPIQNQLRKILKMEQVWNAIMDRMGAECLRRSIDDYIMMCEVYLKESAYLTIQDEGYDIITYPQYETINEKTYERIEFSRVRDTVNYCKTLLEKVNARLTMTAQSEVRRTSWSVWGIM